MAKRGWFQKGAADANLSPEAQDLFINGGSGLTGIARTGKAVAKMARVDKIAVVRFVDAKGGFLVRRSVARVAARLRTSRMTIYSCLQEVRATSDGNSGRSSVELGPSPGG